MGSCFAVGEGLAPPAGDHIGSPLQEKHIDKYRISVGEALCGLELSIYVQSEIPQNLNFDDNALDLRSGA